MKPVFQLMMCLLLAAGMLSCRQTPGGKRLITIVDQSRSVVDVEYTVNDAGGGAFKFAAGERLNEEDGNRYRELPELEATDVIELTPRMINGFSGTTRFDLTEFGPERIFLVIDRNGDISVRKSLPAP